MGATGYVEKRASDSNGSGLWREWWACMEALRPACSRLRTFLWLAASVLGLCARSDLSGVTSWVRTGFLSGDSYRRLLGLFQSTGVDRCVLTRRWIGLVVSRFRLVEVSGHRIVVADGLKVPKEGRMMPGVKSLHQESGNNSKPEYIMGHSWQAVGVLAESASGPVCVPLASRLHDGLKRSPSEKATLLDKLVTLLLPLAGLLEKPLILLADAYYASKKIVLPLLAAGHHLVTRVRSNATAYRAVVAPTRRGRGRPRVYGEKVRLSSLWDSPLFVTAPSPVYGETFITIRYLVQDLVWRPVGRMVRFVLVEHPTRGRLILMTSLVALDPLEVVRLYGLRFKIEVGFKAALHTVGAYGYHFWLKAMTKIRRGSGTQFLHRASPAYRDQVWRKVAAYELHVQLGCIAQGLLQHLAVAFRVNVWGGFRSWMRTMRPDATPSEAVASQALRAALPDFLGGDTEPGILQKFLRSRLDWSRVPGLVMAAND